MMNSFFTHKFLEFLTHKLGSVVGYQLFWKIISGKDGSLDFHSFHISDRFSHDHFWPLPVSIYNYQ